MAEADLTIVIPAYNEEARLRPTLETTLQHVGAADLHAEIIVVDDGSEDGTSRIVEDLATRHPELELVRLPRNRGKGCAVRTGVLAARGRRVLFMDADGSTPMAELRKLQDALDGGADIAIGSRAMGGESVVVARLHRRLIGRCFHTLVRGLGVRGIHDTQCGFKLFRGSVARQLFALSRIDGFSFDVEVLLLAQIAGYEIREVPVDWEHRPGSQIRLLHDSASMLWDLIRLRGHLLTGGYGRIRGTVPHSPR